MTIGRQMNIFIRKPVYFTVTWQVDYKIVKTEQVEAGCAATPPAVDTEKYVFSGWDKPYDRIVSNVTITAYVKIKPDCLMGTTKLDGLNTSERFTRFRPYVEDVGLYVDSEFGTVMFTYIDTADNLCVQAFTPDLKTLYTADLATNVYKYKFDPVSNEFIVLHYSAKTKNQSYIQSSFYQTASYTVNRVRRVRRSRYGGDLVNDTQLLSTPLYYADKYRHPDLTKNSCMGSMDVVNHNGKINILLQGFRLQAANQQGKGPYGLTIIDNLVNCKPEQSIPLITDDTQYSTFQMEDRILLYSTVMNSNYILLDYDGNVVTIGDYTTFVTENNLRFPSSYPSFTNDPVDNALYAAAVPFDTMDHRRLFAKLSLNATKDKLVMTEFNNPHITSMYDYTLFHEAPEFITNNTLWCERSNAAYKVNPDNTTQKGFTTAIISKSVFTKDGSAKGDPGTLLDALQNHLYLRPSEYNIYTARDTTRNDRFYVVLTPTEYSSVKESRITYVTVI